MYLSGQNPIWKIAGFFDLNRIIVIIVSFDCIAGSDFSYVRTESDEIRAV